MRSGRETWSWPGGGYTDDLVPRLRRSILPIATYVLLTEAAPEKIAEAVRTPMAISDNRRAGDYYRLVDDGRRLLWGGRITTRTTEPRRLAEMMQKTMVSTYPATRRRARGDGVVGPHGLCPSSDASHRAASARGMVRVRFRRTRHEHDGHRRASDRGGDPRHQATATGFMSPSASVWNGGPFGVAAAQLTYWTYQAMDLAKERRAARAA